MKIKLLLSQQIDVRNYLALKLNVFFPLKNCDPKIWSRLELATICPSDFGGNLSDRVVNETNLHNQ